MRSRVHGNLRTDKAAGSDWHPGETCGWSAIDHNGAGAAGGDDEVDKVAIPELVHVLVLPAIELHWCRQDAITAKLIGGGDDGHERITHLIVELRAVGELRDEDGFIGHDRRG